MRATIIAVLLVLSTFAAAAPTDVLEVGRNVRNSQVVDPATAFASGTSVVVLSRVHGAAGKQVVHVWRRDGALFQIEHIPSKSEFAISTSRVKVMPGSWTVDVHVGLGRSQGRVSFVVR